MRQPRALTPLYLTEMWERFGFYVTQSLLILYLTSYLHFPDANAFILLGEFTALLYIAPLAGGFLADRVLGPRYAILLGTICFGIGYLLLGVYGSKLLFFSLSIIVIGNGLLKPNISSFLGEFYYPDDPRRDAGFTLFYIGINVGGLLALGGAGFIQQRFGWGTAFGSAAIGMVLAFGTFLYGFSTFENRGLPIPRNQLNPKLRWLHNKFVLALLILAALGIVYLLLSSAHIASILQTILGVVMLAVLIAIACRYEKVQRQKFFVLIILILASIVFWGMLFQIFGAVNLFTDRNVDRHLFGLFTMPTPAFIALESIFIVILGPFLAMLWERLHIKKLDPTPGTKFALAMFSVALAMGILVLAIHSHRLSGYVSPGWIIIFYLFITLGEMLLSPIGLSMVTELSPPHLSGLMMGVWFMALGFGGELSGYLAKQASIPKQILNLGVSDHIYSHAFAYNAIFALIVGIILLILSPFLKRLVKN
jgi:POT family proton-dependent oligopeptide transporter